MSIELTLLVWSVVLLFVHIGLQAGFLTRDLGSAYNAGPRDEKRQMSVKGGRAERALRNFLETWPAFIILVLAGAVAGVSNGFTLWGAVVYIAFRVIYIPLYILGVPYIRSLAFIIACLGLCSMLVGLLI